MSEAQQSENQFVDKMNELTAALRTAVMLSAMVSKGDLDKLERTIERADTMAFVLVRPIDFPQANRNIEGQKKLVEWVRHTRQVYREIIELGEKGGGSGPMGQDAKSILELIDGE